MTAHHRNKNDFCYVTVTHYFLLRPPSQRNNNNTPLQGVIVVTVG
jgi:hypothetical protein